MLRIGVTGLMASGKTDVARAFQERGARVLSGDALGWDVMHEPDVRDVEFLEAVDRFESIGLLVKQPAELRERPVI